MKILKISAMSSLVHGLRMISNLVILKLISAYTGPVGLGQLGNFMSLTSMVSVFAGGGISNGVTKYVSEYAGNSLKQVRFIQSAFTYGAFFSAITLIISFIYHEEFAIRFFSNKNLSWLIPIFGLAQFFCFIGTLSASVATGLQKYRVFAYIYIVSYSTSIPVSYFLIHNFNLIGGALSLLFLLSCTFFPSIFYIKKYKYFKFLKFRKNTSHFKNLSKYSLMLLASATLFPIMEIIIRKHLDATLGTFQTGIWQALNRLSGAYLGFFSVFLTVYYVPKISQLQNKKSIIAEVKKQLILIFFMYAFFAISTYIFRSNLTELLFSKDFRPMENYIGLSLFGDLLRVLSYVIGFVAVSKTFVKFYIFSEFIQTLLYGLISILVIQYGGNLKEVFIGYIATYAIYLTITLVFIYYFSRTNDDIYCKHA